MNAVYPAGAKLSVMMTLLTMTKDAKFLIAVKLIMGLFLCLCHC